MSKHSTSALTMRDALYEAPGPKMRAKIRIGTAISLVAVAVLVALVLQRFYVTGQLSVHYWFFFTHLTTWKFLLAGFEGTVKVALTAGAIALVLGLALCSAVPATLSRCSWSAACSPISSAAYRACCSSTSSFWCCPSTRSRCRRFGCSRFPSRSLQLAYLPRSSVPASTPCRAARSSAQALGLSKAKITFKIVLPQAIRFIIPSLISQLVVVVKDTTVAYVVSYPDLMQNARVLITNYDALVSVYLVIAVIYILINVAINKAAVYVSHKTGATIIR